MDADYFQAALAPCSDSLPADTLIALTLRLMQKAAEPGCAMQQLSEAAAIPLTDDELIRAIRTVSIMGIKVANPASVSVKNIAAIISQVHEFVAAIDLGIVSDFLNDNVPHSKNPESRIARAIYLLDGFLELKMPIVESALLCTTRTGHDKYRRHLRSVFMVRCDIPLDANTVTLHGDHLQTMVHELYSGRECIDVLTVRSWSPDILHKLIIHVRRYYRKKARQEAAPGKKNQLLYDLLAGKQFDSAILIMLKNIHRHAGYNFEIFGEVNELLLTAIDAGKKDLFVKWDDWMRVHIAQYPEERLTALWDKKHVFHNLSADVENEKKRYRTIAKNGIIKFKLEST